jgi:Na+/H+ antiporter NhaD/arsenite permease-like protein
MLIPTAAAAMSLIILAMLYVIRDLGANTGINPWPLYWMLLWAGTLGSNMTIAGAPALYVAKNLGEKEDGITEK